MSREVDAMVAEKVMGWTLWGTGSWATEDGSFAAFDSWSPSTDPATAMEVVERMKSLGFSLDADNFTGAKENPWSVRFGRVAGCWDYDGSEDADTFCKAVCLAALAALRAVGGEGGRKDG